MARPKLIKIKRGIFQDPKSKTYIIRFYSNGKEVERSIGPFLQAAELALNELKEQQTIGQLSGDGFSAFKQIESAKRKRERLFSDACENYLEERKDSKPAYGYIASHDLLPIFGDKPVGEITESDVREFQARIASNPKEQNAKKDETISVSRVNTVMQFLKSVLRQEFRTGNIERDPTLAVKCKQVPKSTVDPLSAEELKPALASLDNNYRPLFAFLANTGCRPNEAIALRWADIDWRKEEAVISKGRVRGNEGLPKTKSAIRTLPLNADAINALNAAKGKSVHSKDNYIFTKPNGDPIDKHLDRIWTRALKAAKVRLRPSYQLRHTFATQCILNGLPLPCISKVLGHSTIEPLVRHYTGWIGTLTEQRDDELRKIRFH